MTRKKKVTGLSMQNNKMGSIALGNKWERVLFSEKKKKKVVDLHFKQSQITISSEEIKNTN